MNLSVGLGVYEEGAQLEVVRIPLIIRVSPTARNCSNLQLLLYFVRTIPNATDVAFVNTNCCFFIIIIFSV